MRKELGNERQYDALRTVIKVVCVVALIFTAGVLYGRHETTKSFIQADEARRTANFSVINWQKTLEDSRIDEYERRIACLDLQLDTVTIGLRELFRDVPVNPSLKIRWNRELGPIQAVLLFNMDELPEKFTDKNGFVFPHWARRGQKGVLIGEDQGMVTVFCLNGPFAGELITFRPQMRKDQQGALAYHF